MFSLSQAIENSRQFLHLRTDIGVTAEYQAILKLYPYNSGYVATQVSLTLTLTLSGYAAMQLSLTITLTLSGYVATRLCSYP